MFQFHYYVTGIRALTTASAPRNERGISYPQKKGLEQLRFINSVPPTRTRNPGVVDDGKPYTIYHTYSILTKTRRSSQNKNRDTYITFPRKLLDRPPPIYIQYGIETQTIHQTPALSMIAYRPRFPCPTHDRKKRRHNNAMRCFQKVNRSLPRAIFCSVCYGQWSRSRLVVSAGVPRKLPNAWYCA